MKEKFFFIIWRTDGREGSEELIFVPFCPRALARIFHVPCRVMKFSVPIRDLNEWFGGVVATHVRSNDDGNNQGEVSPGDSDTIEKRVELFFLGKTLQTNKKMRSWFVVAWELVVLPTLFA